MPNPLDAALKEFESIRAEIAAHQRTKSQYLTLAITATGAIGAFALGRNGNRDALLVLPLVLSGLAIIYMRHNVDTELLGQYVRGQLWPFVSTKAESDLPSILGYVDTKPPDYPAAGECLWSHGRAPSPADLRSSQPRCPGDLLHPGEAPCSARLRLGP